MWQTHGFKEKKKVTFNSNGNETEIDFVLVGKENRKYLQNVKVIPGELQHHLVVVDVNKKQLKKPISKKTVMNRKIWKLNDKKISRKTRRTNRFQCIRFVEVL